MFTTDQIQFFRENGYLAVPHFWSEREVEASKSAASKLAEAPEQSIWLPFSRMELDVLWEAIRNGAEAILQPSSGHRPDQRKAFRDAGNRIADAGGFGPKF